jgi:hypothetical protein
MQSRSRNIYLLVSLRSQHSEAGGNVGPTSAPITAALPPSGTSVQYATAAVYDALNRPTSVSWTPAPTASAPSSSSVTFAQAYNKANQRIGQTATDNSWNQ